MPGFLASRGLLATAWFVLLGVLVGGLALVLVQPPPPPPVGGPVVTALNLPQPEESEADEVDAAELPSDLTSDPAPAADTAMAGPGTAAPEPSPEAPAKMPAAEKSVATAALPVPAASPEHAPAPAPDAPPESPAAALEPAPEPAHAESAAPAEENQEAGHAAAAEAAGEMAEKPPAPPPAVAKLNLPEPKPDSPPEGADAGHDPAAAAGHTAAEAEAHPAAEAAAPAQEQVAAIPVIPPAPEELPYWERYRQPFNMEDKRPRIAVVLSGLGLSDSATEAAINKLPPAVTLSFSPYARGLERWIALARARGHEVMLDLPMEPATFPNEDPGPQGLLVNLSAEDNLDRLDWVLSRGSAYVGLAGAMGSRFTASRHSMKPILDDVKQRGLIFLDRRTTEHSVVPEIAREIGLPRAINNRSVDERQASRVAIDARLAQIERIALTEGFAVAMAQPYPVTLDRLADWATELVGRGFVIAPISALADQQKIP